MKVHYQLQEDTQMLQTTIRFYCQVNGRDCMATIRGLVDHPINIIYRVGFSDGFEDDFTIFENGYVEGEKSGVSKPYAYAIQNDLKMLGCIIAEEEIVTMRWMIEGTHTNIWIKGGVGTDREYVYKIYFNGDYRFELKKEGAGWLGRSRRVENPEKINENLAAEIGRLIDKEVGK